MDCYCINISTWFIPERISPDTMGYCSDCLLVVVAVVVAVIVFQWRSCSFSLLNTGIIVQYRRIDSRGWGVRECRIQQCECRVVVGNAPCVCNTRTYPKSGLVPFSQSLSCLSCDFLVGALEGDKMTKHLTDDSDHVCRVIERKGIQLICSSWGNCSYFCNFVDVFLTNSISLMEMCMYLFILVAAPAPGVM